MNRKTLVAWIGGATVAGSLVAGGLAFEAASAQTPAPATQPPATQPVQPAQPADQLKPLRPERGPGGHQHPGGKLDFVSATATVTGLTVEQVRTELAAGKTPAQLAQSKGKTAQDVVNAALAQHKTQLDTAVRAGTLTQAEADADLTQATEKANTLVNQAGMLGGKGPGGRGGPHRAGLDLVGVTATVTGLTVEQVRTELAAGKSLAQVAQSKGKTADDVLASLRTQAEEQLTKRLEEAKTQLNTPGLR